MCERIEIRAEEVAMVAKRCAEGPPPPSLTIGLHSSTNRRCSNIAEKSKIGSSRHLDTFATTQNDGGGQSHALHYDEMEQKGVGRLSGKTVQVLI